MARRLLIAFPILAIAHLAALHARVIPARPELAVWWAALPIAALVVGPRTRGVLVAAVVELAAVVPLHGLVTLLRAVRLEGG